MNIIKIIPESIRPNPNAGRTETHIPGLISTTFEFDEGHPFPQDFIEGEDFIVLGFEISSNRDKPLKKAQLINHDKIHAINGLGWESQRDVQVMRHLPEPDYHFEYDAESPITCNDPDCNTTTPYSALPENDEGWKYCPACYQEIFDIKTQSVQDAIAEHHLNP